MIVDANELAKGEVAAADLCIVGAGVAGIAMAREFLGTKTTVAIVESGRLEPSARTQSLNFGRNVGVPYYELDQARTRGFGGTSHHWCCELGGTDLGVRLMGLDAIDFERREWVPGSGWPFGKEELDPYYRKAHEFCEIGPYAYTVGEWKERLPAGDVPLMAGSEAVETRIFQFANKVLWYRKYREILEKAPNIRVYLNATVLNVKPNGARSAVSHLEASTMEGKRLRFEAKRYVLAGGGLETPRLMLLSNDVQTGGIGNEHDNVGRYFMEHPHIWTGYIIPAERSLLDRIQLYHVHTVDGTPIMGKFSLRPEIQRRERLLNFTTSIHPAYRQQTPEGVWEFKRGVSRMLRGDFGAAARRDVRCGLGHMPNLLRHGVRKVRRGVDRAFRQELTAPNVLELNPMTEQVPNRDSRVKLGEERDLFGQRRMELDWRLTEQDIDSIRRSQLILAEELKRHGVGELVVELKDASIPRSIHGGWHHMGTTRMDDDPKQGVVDRNCRVHGYGNLFVAGASVFPTVGYANPVLTLIAVTLRLAEHLKTRREE